MEIEAKMWVLYRDEPYFLQEMTKEYYILYNIHNEPTKVYKNEAHFKPIEIPVFQTRDKVISKSNYYPDIKGTIVTITKVEDDVYIPYEINDEYWFTPFDMVSINY